MKLLQALLIAVICKLSLAATNEELEAKTFVSKASERYFNTFDKIIADNYASSDDEDIEKSFTKLSNLQTIASELVEISKEASEFDQTKIKDPELKRALNNLREAAHLYVLGDDYFESIKTTLESLSKLSTDNDIEPYLGGANMPDQDGSSLAYFPDIKKIFETSRDASELQYYWETWRDKNSVWAAVNLFSIVEAIKTAATTLDRPVLELYYSDFDITKFLAEMDKVMKELKPAYQQLHAFIRNELQKKYGKDVLSDDGPIPDHLFEQVLSQAWKEGSVIESYFPFKELPPYDGFVKNFDSRQEFDKAEDFYASLGFSNLDEDFTKNRLIEDSDEACRPNVNALTPKVYMKYCTQVDFRKFMQMHGYIGQIHYAQEKKNLPSYYYNSYNLEYPVGEAVILSACTPKHLQSLGLAKDFTFTDKTLMNRLFRMGIHTILNIPVFYVHSKIMNEFLNGTVDSDGVNKRYWKLMEDYAGVEPPLDREENVIDFPYKFYFDLEHNHQTQKFVSEILGYQFYRAFCQKSGQQGQLHNCDFYGNKEVGNVMKSMMSLGSTQPWEKVIAKVLTDKPSLSADALLEYYKPIIDWLKNENGQNKSKIGWKESEKVVL